MLPTMIKNGSQVLRNAQKLKKKVNDNINYTNIIYKSRIASDAKIQVVISLKVANSLLTMYLTQASLAKYLGNCNRGFEILS